MAVTEIVNGEETSLNFVSFPFAVDFDIIFHTACCDTQRTHRTIITVSRALPFVLVAMESGLKSMEYRIYFYLNEYNNSLCYDLDSTSTRGQIYFSPLDRKGFYLLVEIVFSFILLPRNGSNVNKNAWQSQLFLVFTIYVINNCKITLLGFQIKNINRI